MLREYLDDLYIPQDERQLKRFQRKVEELDRSVRAWAQSVLDVLPKGITLHEDEVYILGLYLAQQRRLNLELDIETADPAFPRRVVRALPFVNQPEEPEMVRAAHRVVASRLESDIERACDFFCRDLNVPALSDPAIDWRVSIRFMAQAVHNLARDVNMKRYPESPRRFEIALIARDLSVAIVDKRRAMIAAFSAQPAEY